MKSKILVFTLIFINQFFIKELFTKNNLSLKEIKNASFYLFNGKKKIKFINGRYKAKSNEEFFDAVITDYIVFGNLDNDEFDEAALIFCWTGGGSGIFYLLGVADKVGKLLKTTTTEIGDRIEIKSLRIKNKRIFLDIITHGEDDAMCCPTERKLFIYELKNDKLNLLEEKFIEKVKY